MTPRSESDTGRPKGIGPREVLVVEDDPAIRKLVQIVVEQQGFITREAPNFGAAQTAIEDYDPALIILDLGLPDGSGLDLLKWVRDDLGRSTPIIILTAYGQDAKVEQAYSLGANDFMTKPFRPKELVQRIQRIADL